MSDILITERLISHIDKLRMIESVDKPLETLKSMGKEIRMLRSERKQLMQTFIPLSNEEDPAISNFKRAFQDLCMERQVPAAVVFAYPKPDGGFGMCYGGMQSVVSILLEAIRTGGEP